MTSRPLPAPDPSPRASPRASSRLGWIGAGLLLAVLGGLVAYAFPVSGVGLLDDPASLMSFKTLALNYGALKHYVDAHTVAAMALYVLAYVVLAVTMLPGSILFIVASGLLFGSSYGPVLASFASTVATTAAFLLARTVVGRRVADFDNAAFQKLKAGFARHALSYMLFLRLTPGPPFALINMGPALIGVPLSTFVTGTFFGLLPSRIALSTAGAGLAQSIAARNAEYSQCLAAHGGDQGACPYDLELSSLLTNQMVAAFVALALLALLPVLIDAVGRLRALARARRAEGKT